MEEEIIPYGPELAAEVCELQTHLWGPDVGLNRRYLEWKYHRNPYLLEPVIGLAAAEGRLVAMVGMYGVPWEVGDPPRAFLGPCAGDWVVAPSHRGRGLSTRVMAAAFADLAARDVDHAFTMTWNERSFRIGLASGWRSIGPLLPLVRYDPAGLLARVGRRARRLAGRHEHVYRLLDRHLGRPSAGRVPVTIDTQPHSDAMAELRARVRVDGRIRQRPDPAYIDWRYRNPFSHYRFLYWHGQRLEGYLVLQTSARRRESEVRVLEWEATNPSVRSALLRTALDRGRFERVTIWSATLPTDAQEMLAASGFAPEPRAGMESVELPTVHVHPTREAPSDTAAGEAPAWTIAGMPLLDRRNWDVRMADSDGF